ncbi:MAG: hypothetical protein QUS14_08870, partial [Pyrinomonadaceae bacterium]|nr:hypothetical protein [Pyrinomonadaceae bacterium]
MLFELKLLRRTLFARRRGLVGFTALAAVLGIAAGVASLIVAQAVATGFQAELRNAILAGSPHITVFRADGGPISNASDLQHKLAAVPGIVSADAVAVHAGVIRGPGGNGFAVVTVDGGATVDVETTYEADIGVELAATTGLNEGSKAEVFLAQKDGELFKLNIVVSSLTRTGLFDRDSTSIKLKPLADTAKINASPNQLELRIADVFGSSRVAAQVRAIAGEGFRVV